MSVTDIVWLVLRLALLGAVVVVIGKLINRLQPQLPG